jgi:plasmid stabilization system protein ParE
VKFARLSKRAQQDLELIREYISRENPQAAEAVRFVLLATADLLAQNVEAGTLVRNAPPRHADVRWLVAPRFRNYLIFYRPSGDTILVLRILHAKQDWTRFFGGSQR